VSEKDFKILGLAASLRRASIHRGILRAAHEVCPEGMACDSFDLGRIPFFNADVEAKGDPEAVRELKEKIRTYNAVLMATPEYDYAIPGVLTSALDWCLRSSSLFRHKPVGIAGASPSGAGTVLGQMSLRQTLLHGLRDARAPDADPERLPALRRERRPHRQRDPPEAPALSGDT
jgi:chromate reductase, NAD(P)H dehydrogenase (quinone)